MSLLQLKKQYIDGEISKAEYIEQMYFMHQILFEYQKLMKNTDIEKIEISDQGVLTTSRKTQTKILSEKPDRRVVPIEILNFGEYEKIDSDMIYRLIEPGFTVFDIGANIGWYSINIAKLAEGVKVYAFEPIPSTFQSLLTNIQINDLNNIKPENIGLSNRPDQLTFYLDCDQSVSASSANIMDNQTATEIVCHVTTLDIFVKEQNINRLDFIKCDVEGAELMVYQGGIETLKEHKPIIFTEMLRKWSAKFNYHPNDIIRLLASIDYRCFVAKEDQLVEILAIDDNTIETNFFFLNSITHQTQIEKLVIN